MFKKYLAYIKDNPNHYWFKRKPFGWGWTPVMWQGWVTLAVYIGVVVFLASVIYPGTTLSVLVVLLTALLIYISYKKGEKPGWQWGWNKK